MSAYKPTGRAGVPTSWGRTRRPKHLVEHLPPSGTKQSPTKVEVIASDAALNANLNDATEGENGYSTENQRFLHVFVKHNDAGEAPRGVYIYAYNYAFGEWAPLYLPVGNGASNASHALAEAVCDDDATSRLYIFDISGVDRVAFVANAQGAPHRVRAACTTF